jgi:hypothetical protein
MKFNRGKKRATGFSLPFVGGGLDWHSDVGEREVIERLVIQLGEKRALYQQHAWEEYDWVNASVIEVRSWLTAVLTVLHPGSDASRLVEHLRAACNRYLTAAGRPAAGLMPPAARDALEALRETFRVTLAYIGANGNMPAATALARAISEGLQEVPSHPGRSDDDSA